jgi:hypothetical protein
MKKLILILALALLLCSCVDGATKIGLDRLNWSQSIDGIKIDPSQINLTKLGTIDIQDYGAIPNDDTDDTASIQAAIDAMSVGDQLLIPPGTFNITSIIFDPPDECTLMCRGNLSGDSMTAGTAFQIGNTSSVRRGYRIEGLQVLSSMINWTDGRIGVKTVNIQECIINYKQVRGFHTNVFDLGRAGMGNGYNTIYLGLIYNGKVGVRINQTDPGWCNENSYYGGRFTIQSGLSSYADTVHVEIDSGNGSVNNHRFYNPSFESGSTDTESMSIHGRYIYVYTPRLESAGNITLEAESYYSVVYHGRGTSLETSGFPTCVKDLGIRNQIYTMLGNRFVGATQRIPTLTLKTHENSVYKALSVIGWNDVEGLYLRGDGVVATKDGITAPTTATGFALIYVDTSDGDLKVKFGDGTTKVIAADT